MLRKKNRKKRLSLILVLTMIASTFSIKDAAYAQDTVTKDIVIDTSEIETVLEEETSLEGIEASENNKNINTQNTPVDATTPATEQISEQVVVQGSFVSIAPMLFAQTVTTEAQLRTALSNADSDITITIGGDFNLTSSVTIPSGKTVTIKGDSTTRTIGLSGFSATHSATSARHFIVSGASTTLTLGSNLTLDGRNNLTGSPVAGGIAVTSSGAFYLEGATIQNCRNQDYGGGVYFGDARDGRLSSGLIKDCQSWKGGGVYISESSNPITLSGTIVIDSCKAFSKADTTDGRAKGGGVFVNGKTLTMIDSATVRDCQSDSFGGGIAFQNYNTFNFGTGSDSPQIIDCNTSLVGDVPIATQKNGGGVFWLGTGPFNFKSGTISGCAGTEASGVYMERSTPWTPTTSFNMSGGSIINNGPGVGGNGGGLWLKTATATISGTASISGNSVTKPASSGGNGAGIFATGSSIVNIQGGTINNNSAQQGSGLYIGGSTIVNMSGGEIAGNTSPGKGAGVFASGTTCKFNMTGGAIKECKTTSGGQGAGIYAAGATISLIGTESSIPQILDCETFAVDYYGAMGGAICATGSTQLALTNALISGCKTGGKLNSNSGLGAGIYIGTIDSTVSTVVANITNTVIEKCSSESRGGGMYVAGSGSSVTIKNTTIRNNTALGRWADYQSGGGLYIKNATVTATDTTIAGNSGTSSSSVGGGICLDGGTIDMTNGIIDGNVAAKAGAGIFATSSSVANLKGTTVSNSVSNNGGGIYLTGSSLVASGATITKCSTDKSNPDLRTTAGAGGGVYVDDTSTADLCDSSITNCKATGHGGGVFTKAYANVVTNASTTFTGNSAAILSIPATDIASSSYSCLSASSVSPTNAELDNRIYPLNNYDINYLSYRIIYDGNKGTLSDGQKTVSGYREYLGWTSDSISTTNNYTVLSNDNSLSSLGGFANTGYDYDTWCDGSSPTPETTRWDAGSTLTIADTSVVSRTGGYPTYTLYALWKTTFDVQKIVTAPSKDMSFLDLDKAYTIEVTVRDANKNVVLTQTKNLKHKASIADIPYYQGQTVTVTETNPGNGVTVTYNIDETDVTSVTDRNIGDDFEATEDGHLITVTNTCPEVVITGIDITKTNILWVILLMLILLCGYMFEKRLRRKRLRKRIKNLRRN